jgi:hypothetical protein
MKEVSSVINNLEPVEWYHEKYDVINSQVAFGLFDHIVEEFRSVHRSLHCTARIEVIVESEISYD